MPRISTSDTASPLIGEPTRPISLRVGRVASALIILPGLLALAVLGVAVSRLGAGFTVAQFVLFVVLPGLFVLGTALVLRATAETRVGVAMALVSLGFAVGVSELGAAVWLGLQARAFERPTLRSHLTRIRGTGVEAFPRIPGNQIVDLDPQVWIGGEVKRPVSPGPAWTTILHCDEGRPMLTYQSDRFGFDNPDSVWESSSTKLAVLGDSYTVGVCVPPEEAIPGRLRSHGALLNLGMSGAGPLQELALLREYVAPRKPAMVIWIFFEGNDLYDLGRETNREWLREYLAPRHSQKLAENRVALDSGYRIWIDSLFEEEPEVRPPPPLWRVRDLVRLTAIRRVVPVAISLPNRDERIEILVNVLARARADVEGWGGRFLVAYLPAYRRYGTAVGDPHPEKVTILRRLEDLSIQTLDLHDAFVATGNPRALWVTPRSHLSAAGYGIATEAIEAALDLRSSRRP